MIIGSRTTGISPIRGAIINNYVGDAGVEFDVRYTFKLPIDIYATRLDPFGVLKKIYHDLLPGLDPFGVVPKAQDR